MEQTEALNVEARQERGKHKNRRLRNSGRIPATLYGHGKPPVSLAVSSDAVDAIVRRGARMVKLTGAVTESAFIRECQWDTWGMRVMHVDFTRISAHEKVKVEVSVELRGESPGLKAGGTVQHLVHELEVECEAMSIPEKFSVNINHLELDQSITVADLELPGGVAVLAPPETVIVQCIMVAEAAEEAVAEGAEAEPELIGRKKAEEEEAES
ncbi:MAG: 50S ribosomal protein L25 [Thermoguttaceae bacterium]|jgi:large subunit ribosomal protein L25